MASKEFWQIFDETHDPRHEYDAAFVNIALFQSCLRQIPKLIYGDISFDLSTNRPPTPVTTHVLIKRSSAVLPNYSALEQRLISLGGHKVGEIEIGLPFRVSEPSLRSQSELNELAHFLFSTIQQSVINNHD